MYIFLSLLLIALVLTLWTVLSILYCFATMRHRPWRNDAAKRSRFLDAILTPPTSLLNQVVVFFDKREDRRERAA